MTGKVIDYATIYPGFPAVNRVRSKIYYGNQRGRRVSYFYGTAAMSPWSSSLPAFDARLCDTKSNTSAVVFVWAAWDPVCKRLEAALRQAQSDYPSLHFFGLDLDDQQNWPLARTWGVEDTRTLVCLVKGRFHELIIARNLDAPTEAKLSAWNQLAGKQEEIQ